MKIMNLFKLRHKIILFSILIIVSLSVALSTALLIRTNAVIRQEFRERADSVLENIAREAELGVLVENRRLLGEKLDEFANVKDVAYVRIFNRNSELLLERVNLQRIEEPGILRASRPVVISPEARIRVGPGPGRAAAPGDAAAGTPSPPETIGRVEIGFSTGTVKATFFKITFMVVLVTLIFIAVGILVSCRFSTRITRPINQLVTATQKVSRGELDYRIDISARDEIGELARAFNKMTGDLKRNLDDLKSLAGSLELKVKERTAELEEANKKLQDSNIRIKEADRMKTQFIARMSHELRTPLNSILGFAGLLLQGVEGELSEAVIQDLRIIEGSGRHLLALINNILDLARIESGRMELYPETLNLDRIIDEVIEEARVLKGEKNITIGKNTGTLPPVRADQTKIRQILLNLLGNALKFTREGSVTIGAERRGREIAISVSDTGIGIRESRKAQVFEEFNRLQGSSPGTTGGAGLGLAITKKLVEMHGGRVEMASNFGRGSTFTFTLPLDKETKTDGR